MPILISSMAGRRAVAVGTTLLALAIAGCGSSSTTTSTKSTSTKSTSSGLSKSALVSKVDPICKSHTDVITAAASKMLAGGKLPTAKAFGQFAGGTVIPQTAAEIAQLSPLKPEAKLTRSYAQWLAALQAALAAMKKNPIIIQQSKPFVTVNHEAKAQGFSSACDVGPST